MPAKKSRWDFWNRVNLGKPDECWNWTGYKTVQGYGRITAEGQNWWVHRLAYESKAGYLPPWSSALEVQHICSNPSCCNPNHLWLGDRSSNMKTAGELGNLSRKGSSNGNSKLTLSQVKAIKEDVRPSRQVAEDYGIEKTQVLRIRKGVHWSEQ